MKNFILRMIIFISAAALTIALPRLLAGELSRQSWMAVGFLIAAEALTCLPGSMMNKRQSPFFLPVRFVVFPGYLSGGNADPGCGEQLSQLELASGFGTCPMLRRYRFTLLRRYVRKI